jgi:hypothetical protein
MGKILIVLAIIVIAYWYWSGLNQNSGEMYSGDDPKKNAQIIADCVARGDFAQAGEYSDRNESPKYICADENNLYSNSAGEWHRR